MTHVERVPAGHPLSVSKRLDTMAWGLFFVWVGVTLIANLGWGLGLLGIGIIALSVQLARRYFDLGIEGFWVIVGLLFVAGGAWDLLAVRVSLVPIVLIVAGAALLLSTTRKMRT